jgi:predicted PurR-regulated permease PerM
MSSEQAARRFTVVLLVASMVLLAAIIAPVAPALLLAAVLAGVLWPVQQRLAKKIRGRRGLSAGVFVVGVVILLVGPLVGLSTFVVNEATGGLKFVTETVRSEGVSGIVERLPNPIRRLGTEAVKRLPHEPEALRQMVEKQFSLQGGKAAAAVGAVVSATTSLLFQTSMMLIAFFFLLVHGDQAVAWLDSVSPLRPGQTRELLTEFKKVSYAVMVSTFITAGVQAAVALIGYFIAHVPRPLFFAIATFFVAFIPAIGAASVCIVAALLMFVTGHPYAAIFLAIWGVAVVGLVDNIVKPLLIKGGMQMHEAVVFFALIGGLAVFGTIGLLLGPLVVSLFLAVLRMYNRDFLQPEEPSRPASD